MHRKRVLQGMISQKFPAARALNDIPTCFRSFQHEATHAQFSSHVSGKSRSQVLGPR